MNSLSYSLPKDSILFDSQDEQFKTPFGATPCGENIKFNILTQKNINCLGINLIIKNGKILEFKMLPEAEKKIGDHDYIVWSLNFTTPSLAKTIFYHFKISIGNENTIFYYGNNSLALGGRGDVYENFPIDYQITLYYKNNPTPNWFKGLSNLSR